VTSHFSSLLGYPSDVRASPPQPRVLYKNTSPALAGKASSAAHPTACHQDQLVRFVKLTRLGHQRVAIKASKGIRSYCGFIL